MQSEESEKTVSPLLDIGGHAHTPNLSTPITPPSASMTPPSSSSGIKPRRFSRQAEVRRATRRRSSGGDGDILDDEALDRLRNIDAVRQRRPSSNNASVKEVKQGEIGKSVKVVVREDVAEDSDSEPELLSPEEVLAHSNPLHMPQQPRNRVCG